MNGPSSSVRVPRASRVSEEGLRLRAATFSRVKRACIYHAGCPDGFGAAWAVWRAWGDVGRFVARGHEDPFDVSAHQEGQVVFVDIAPKNDLLCELAEVAAQVVVLDHHLSARDHYEGDPSVANRLAEGNHFIHYDLEHSGAVLAWQHFHPDDETPELLCYVEDQDLWNWKLPHTQAVNAALGTYPHEFSVWDELSRRPVEELVREGEPLLRGQQREVERAVKTAHPIAIDTLRIEAVNSAQFRSHIGHELAKRAAFGHPIGLVYKMTGRRVDASIYSIDETDVSVIARRFGGGGHRNASGFSVTLEKWLADFI